MTIHKSLRIKTGANKMRNVLKRDERLAILQKDGRWEEGKSVYGLPKTKTGAVKKKK
ncbi:small basic protein [Candidatus Uabimicrobium sp. HlEnr_7]|uniref:small basic protein n=1 Tax=Candidatus Uabimicrobium helgolandensis TaxID=3095367 RepID=UPI0035566CE1